MKAGDPASQVNLAHVDQCLKAAAPPPTPQNPKPRNSITHSTFKSEPLMVGNMPVHFIALVASIVRTSAAGSKVSAKSTAATTSLAEGVLEYISSTPAGLAVDPRFNELKEFVGTTYTGILGAGLAFLRMLHDGYMWKAHYEELKVGGGGVAQPEPDFAFAKPGDVAIVESKGTGKDLPAAIAAAKNGYLRQVHPVANVALSGLGLSSHGYAFGTALNAGLQQTSPFVQMAMVFSEFVGSSGVAPSRSTVPPAPGVNQAFVNVHRVREANYKEVFAQLGLDISHLQAAAQLPLRDENLFQSPWRHTLEIDGEPWTATIALPMRILRDIERGRFPDGLVEAMRNRGPTIRQGTKDSNLVFVNFPDHTRVLMRRVQSSENTEISEVVLE